MLLPVRQYVCGDEVDAGSEIRMLAPNAIDFACRYRNSIDRLLDALDQLYQPMDVVFINRPFGGFGALVLGLVLCVLKPLTFLTLYSRGLRGINLHFGLLPKILQRDLLAAENCFVADDDADDVAVLARKADRSIDLPIVAIAVRVDPGADRHLHAEFGGDRGYQFSAFRRGVQTHGPRERGELSQVTTNLFGIGNWIGDRVTSLERRVGSARQDAAK